MGGAHQEFEQSRRKSTAMGMMLNTLSVRAGLAIERYESGANPTCDRRTRNFWKLSLDTTSGRSAHYWLELATFSRRQQLRCATLSDCNQRLLHHSMSGSQFDLARNYGKTGNLQSLFQFTNPFPNEVVIHTLSIGQRNASEVFD